MTDDDELFRLNSLHRFTKHSKLVLEAHSHCEVPAGCGGAVLQWLDPAQGAPVRVEAQSPWYADATFIDGKRLNSAGVRLQPGAHVLALTLMPPARGKRALEPWLMVNMVCRVAAPDERRVRAGCTAADGTWRMADVEPPSGWNLEAFDDARWTTPKTCTDAHDGLEEWARERFARLSALGCVPLGFSGKGLVWFRKRFELAENP
jgi:hypothetical protein